MASYGFRSGVCVPIPGAEGPWGALSVHSNHNRIYNDRDVSFLQTVASVLSAAIRRLDLDRLLHERSMHDPLTGLPNRTLAYERIEQALARAERDDTSIAVLLLDIDDFKIINDSLGHEAGDRALVRFSGRLAAAARPQDTVARVGGDEFLIISEHISGIDQAQQLAHALTASINTPHAPGYEPTPLSASIGIAVSDPSSTRQELIRRADLAMYRAKDTGTGGHAVFDRDDVYDADRTRRLSMDLRVALGRGELNLRYQPLVDITTREIVAMEALARWTHPTLGVIDPIEFVAAAERTGLVGDLGEWALRTACAQAAVWRTFTDVGVRVNISALQLRDGAFAGKVAAVLAATGLDPAALGLEITETVWVADTARVAGTLGALHQMGVGISLDDLGSGYSSISYLNRYPVFECFKIDKSYIEDLPAARAKAIIVAIVMLARAFDLTVVGEGVETVEQLETLQECGCDLAQGFLLGRPMTSERATAELRQRAHTVDQRTHQHDTGADEHRCSGSRIASSRQPTRPTVGITLRPKRPRRRVRDRVVQQYRERGEPDRAAHIDHRRHNGDDDSDHDLGAVRGLEPRMHGGQRGRQMPVAGHRQRGARDTEDQREQRTERSDRRTRANHRLEAGHARRHDGLRQRRRCRSQSGAAQFAEHRDRDHGVHDQCDAERDGDGPWDRTRGITHLLTESGDARVACEGEEQQASGLQHAADGDIVAKRQPGTVGVAGAQDHDHDGRQHGQHHGDDDAGQHADFLMPV